MNKLYLYKKVNRSEEEMKAYTEATGGQLEDVVYVLLDSKISTSDAIDTPLYAVKSKNKVIYKKMAGEFMQVNTDLETGKSVITEINIKVDDVKE